MAGSPGESDYYPAAVEDEETVDYSDRSVGNTMPVQSSPVFIRYGAVEDDDTGGANRGSEAVYTPVEDQRFLPNRLDASGPDDVRCLAQKLEHVRLSELAPPELRLSFFHATVVQDRSSLSAEAASRATALADALRHVCIRDASASARGACASVGALDPSCNSPNDFVQFATSVARQFDLAFQCSGLLFVCLTAAQLDDDGEGGWLQFVLREAPTTISDDQSMRLLENVAATDGRAEVVFVFVDGEPPQSPSLLLGGSGYSVEAMLSGNVQLAAMLEKCLPRRSSWLRKRDRRLEQWRSQRALELLMEEREEQHQRLLSTQRLLTSLNDQRSEHAAAVAQIASPSCAAVPGRGEHGVTPGGFGEYRQLPASVSSASLSLRNTSQRSTAAQQQWKAWLSDVRWAARMPSTADLMKHSCSQKHVKHFHEGENWSRLFKLPRFGITLLYGLPGVGKTQLALRFADCIDSEKHPLPVFVYIFHFDTTEAFAADVSLLAEQMNVGNATVAAAASGDPSSLHDQFCNLIHALKSSVYASMHKVLILDGADASRFKSLLGKTTLLEKQLAERRTDFLFLLTATSCQHYETEHADSMELLEVEPLSPKEVEEVMRRDDFFSRYGGDLPSLARDLRTELCGLPLGLFPALAYMRRTSCTVKQYLQRLERAEMAADGCFALGSPPNQRTARQAIRLAVADLVEQQRLNSYTKATMVLLVACFARQELPTELLHSCLSLRAQRTGSASGGDSLGACDDFGGDVDEIIGDLKAACLLENDAARYMDRPVVTVHKVVHDVLSDMLVRDHQGQLGEVLDLALRGAFIEVELDTRQRRSREHAILMHPHVTRLVTLARIHDPVLAYGGRLCAKLCLVYLLQAAAYMHLEAGDIETALVASSDAVDCFCELLGTTYQDLMGACNHIEAVAHGSSGGGSSSSITTVRDCSLMWRLDELAKATRMSRLLRQRRTHVTTQDWPDHMAAGDYERLVKQGSAIDAARLDALYPHELLAATLYMRGRALKRSNCEAAGTAYRLCLHVCERVRLDHGGTLLVYGILARRSGMRCLYPLPQAVQSSQLLQSSAFSDCCLGPVQDGASAATEAASTIDSGSHNEVVWLRDTIERYKALARDDSVYFQMGIRKVQPSTDDLHQLLCWIEIVRCLRRLHQLVAEAERDAVCAVTSSSSSLSPHLSPLDSCTESPSSCRTAGPSLPCSGTQLPAARSVTDDTASKMAATSAEALAIQRESFKHGQRMLEMAKEMDASLRGPCYIEHGHLTLQMLPGNNGAAHAVPYYGCGLAELVAANMPARAAAAIRQIAERHRELGRVPSDDLFGMVTSYLDRLSGDGVALHIKGAQASMDSLRAVHKLYQIIKTDPDRAAHRLRNAFGSAQPRVCRATSTESEEEAYAWHQAARETGYSDANIMKECRLWLAEGREIGKPAAGGETAECGPPN